MFTQNSQHRCRTYTGCSVGFLLNSIPIDCGELSGKPFFHFVCQLGICLCPCGFFRITLAYDGHDVDYMTGEEYGIAKAVCKNPHIEDGQLWVDIEFVDSEYEALLVTLMEKGIEIGVSSVGYGEQDPMSGIIIPESYELVRFLDFVVCPAGEVYLKMGERTRKEHRRRSAETVVKTDADKAMAGRRSKVARDLAKFFIRRDKE